MPGESTNMSHAVGDSVVPQKLQEKLPKGVEEAVPNKLHDTGADTSGASHKTGDSYVPGVLQETVPTKVEEVLPEKIHPTK